MMSNKQKFFVTLRTGDVDAIAEMLKADSKLIHSHDPQGRTPLEYAIQNNLTKVAIWLIDHGANVDAASLIGDGPLEMAKRARLHEVVNHLIANGAVPSQCSDSDIDQMKEKDVKEFFEALKTGNFREIDDVYFGNMAYFENKDVNRMRNENGMTPLEYVEANRKNIRNSDEIIWWLKQEAERTESD